MLSRMRLGRVLTTALLIGFSSIAAASASPITNPASLNADGSAHNAYTSPLFDLAGNPFLLIAEPTYVSAYFNGNNDGNNGIGNDFSTFGSFVTDLLFSASFGPGLGNPGGNPNEDGVPGDNTGDPDNTNNISSIIDDVIGIEINEPGPQGNETQLTSNDLGPSAPRVPEPATLLLLGSGLVAIARRRTR